MSSKKIRITWLGHSTFKVVSPEGTVSLIDPWVSGNPACPEAARQFDRLDIMFLTHGHFDHIGDAVELGKQYSPEVVGIYELGHWLEGKGVGNIRPMNKGGSQRLKDLSITMVHADHSCGILDDGRIIYGGEAVGYIIEFSTGLKIYHAGDTNLFGDMKLIGQLYSPHLAMLPIGDLFTMSPREAAHACTFVGAKTIIPMHFGTFPQLTGTPQKLRELTGHLPKLEIIDMKPGNYVDI
jgi:L-ascorbate metabolism protein UlaG (beta-lactamase superfamily)